MDNKKYHNLCYRCGSERIISKTYKEGTGINRVDVVLTVCPNPECQKKVNKELNAAHKKNLMMAHNKEKRLLARKNGKKV